MREKSPGRWELRVFLGEDPVTGKKRYLSRTVVGGKRVASSELAKLVAAEPGGETSRRRAQAKMSLSDLVEQHIERHPGSPTTTAEYRAVLERYIRPSIGRLRLTEINAGILDQFYEHLGRERGLAPSTIRQVHAIIRGALSRAVKWGWTNTNPARDASPPTVRRSEPVLPTPDTVLRAIRIAQEDNPAFGLFLRLAAATGARRGELCALKWTNLDLDDALIRIENSSYSQRGGPVITKDTKNHSKRDVSIDPVTVQSLSEHRRRLTDRATLCGIELATDSFVFSNDADGAAPWRPDFVTGAWTRLRRKADLGSVRLHDLRHLQATMLLQNGIPVKDVSRRIGHRDAATTLNVYAHVLESTDRRSAGVIGNLLNPSDPDVIKLVDDEAE